MENDFHLEHDCDAEEALIGAAVCLGAWLDVSKGVKPEYFSIGNRRLWEGCGRAYEEHGETTMTMVSSLVKMSKDYVAGDMGKLAGCSTKCPSSTGKALEAYRKRVIINHVRRSAINGVYGALVRIPESDDPASEIISASEGLEGISAMKRVAGSISEWMEETDYMEDFVANKTKPMFSGVRDLDEIMGGFHKGELSFIAARPSVGKTTLALAFARFMARNGFRPAFVSAEMSVRALLDRILAMESGNPVRRYRSGQERLRKDSEHANRILAGMGSMSDLDMLFVNAHGSGPSAIKSALLPYWAKGRGPDIIFIDYIQLLQSDSEKERRNDEMAAMSSALMQMADEFDCHVCCLSQLSRDGANIEPQLHHLRDSGTLEQDANQVLMAWKPKHALVTTDKRGSQIHLKVAKNRDGMTGQCVVSIDFSTYSITD